MGGGEGIKCLTLFDKNTFMGSVLKFYPKIRDPWQFEDWAWRHFYNQRVSDELARVADSRRVIIGRRFTIPACEITS